MTLTTKQKEIVKEVTKRLSKHKWFRGVCLDRFPSDAVIDKDRENAILDVMDETAYWDGPTLGMKE